MRNLTLFLTLGVFAGSLVTLSGCANTVRGVGQDTANTVNATKRAGKKVVRAAGG